MCKCLEFYDHHYCDRTYFLDKGVIYGRKDGATIASYSLGRMAKLIELTIVTRDQFTLAAWRMLVRFMEE